jgi:DNA (cytosine-5)-methyltransferase 1
MENYNEWDIDAIDLLVGGTPCQSFSLAGLRKGMADPRGNLSLVFLGVANKFRPRWVVWENVPGVLSSRGGRDFGSFLGAMAKLGYGFAYRVLDAQYLPRFYLSPKACAGLIRRAEKRGKKIPEELLRVLQETIERGT